MSPKRPHSTSTIVVRADRLDPRGFALGEEVDGQGEVAVWGALPGELVGVEVRGGGQRRRWGVATEWHEQHPGRIEPPCPLASRCGGCSVQFADRDTQLAEKRERVVRAFVREGLPTGGLGACESVGPPLGYRSKFQPMARWSDTTGLELGLFEAHSHALVPIAQCPAQDEPTRAAAASVASVLRAAEPPVDWLRAVLIRSNGDRAVVTLLVREESCPPEDSLRRWAAAMRAAGPIDGVALNISPAQGNALVGPETRALDGEPSLLFQLADAEFRAGPVSFVQANLAAAEEMVRQIRQWAERVPERGRALDLYAGVGMFAVALAPMFEGITAVEAATSAASWCQKNLAGQPGCEVVEAPVVDAVRDLGPASFVVADPPRAGLGPSVVRSLAEVVRPHRMALVSCWPESCARDLAALRHEGYELGEIRLLDLFPQTLHVEILAELVRPAKQGGPNP